ncbi:carbohydrate-binding module family 1 protein [Annulohypoxylon maeteangense]|uniref:carbohydrate-binding module family 1 protein n=1 Tax=Annulohypoxylon maeteangense TaxID=1927788 RepID=UPI002007E031|nr:carbohydrate-binding module family 1 protein [Annulohypoxylon maeteangense]KAI0888791.1 carbohydrate-binding module family 1 protein [Annulohypoxylon maeteangense]
MAHFGSLVKALLLLVVLNAQKCLCQNSTPTAYTDSATGITFDTWIVPDKANGAVSGSIVGGYTFGVALPENALTTNANELIGYLKCGSNGTTTNAWCGISFGGTMTNSLLLMAWPYEDQVLTSFRFATGYSAPAVYTGNATLTQISSTIDENHFSVIFRCQNCFSWDQDGATGSASTSSGTLLLGWASSLKAPTNPACPADIALQFHSNGDSLYNANLDSAAANPSYTEWVSKATATVTGSCGTTTPTTTTSVSTTTTTSATGVPVPTATYDYIVVGAGAGGIPLADKLSEAGNSVLLIEKGPPSSGRWGGSLKPEWLDGTNLTRFDVPGLCNQIWVDSTGIACTDTDQMAGCVLGGGTAVNAGLWWKPYSLDWDYNFPTGWKSADMAAATSRVFSRIPGTYAPSMDGKMYYQQGFEVLSGGLKTAGWAEVTANDVPDEKNHTYSHTPFMFSGGERGGPMATYLVSANGRTNFHLWTNTSVKRVVRTGGHITGIEVEPFLEGGYAGTVNVTSVTGRVILSAGTFGSAKILLRSGIGPADQLAVVQSSADGPSMISNTSWIDLPVGYNLEDHTNTDTVITHPDVVFYDYYGAWDNPNTTDKDQYINSRSGMFAQAAPNIGPMFWDEITGDDGIVRQLQWTARVEGSDGTPSGTAMTMSQYLGRGATSRGRMTITKALNTVVSTLPYLRDENDVQAVIQGIKNLQSALSNVRNLTWTYPSANTTVEDFVNDMLVSYTNRRSNHWIGTNKLGSDDGRANGSAVVDLDTRVYGTDNLFVVDASIFPGHITTNPSAYIVIAAEHASERILSLSLSQAQSQSAQCGGLNWTGSFQCTAPYTCTYQNATYSQCL